MNTKKITLWSPQQAIHIPKNELDPGKIAPYAQQLTRREKDQIISAFSSGQFEMSSIFIWSKTMAGLKKQISSLGMDFVGEMLDRPDISSHSSAVQDLTDYDAVKLAEELGMFPSIQAMRLRRVMDTVTHFSSSSDEDGEGYEMTIYEALDCLSTCIEAVLGHEKLEGAIEFTRFRQELEEKSFRETDEEIQRLLMSPYFFQRTTLRVLLSLAKTAFGAQLEHSLANVNIIIPLLWERLLKSDRWLVGRAYSEVYNEGKTTTAAGLRKALLRVQGFDYVPEDLRSRSFIAAAEEIIRVHFSMNNYYNEPTVIGLLSSLGTVIPIPALARCTTAILCIRVGNRWGQSWAAQDTARDLLSNYGESRWRFYLNDCLPGDDTILEKLTESPTVRRWFQVVEEYNLSSIQVNHKGVHDLITASSQKKTDMVINLANRLLETLRNG